MILTLDLATTTGYCFGVGDQSPALGHIRMPDTKEDVGTFLDYYFRWLHNKITDLQAEANVACHPTPYGAKSDDPKALIVVFEAPLEMRARIDPDPTKKGRILQAPTSAATSRKLKGLAGVTEMVCIQRGVLCEEVNVQTIRAAMGALPGSEKGADTMAAAERCGLKPKVHDEADAFGIWICAMRAYAKQYQHLWDQRLYGRRVGGLV